MIINKENSYYSLVQCMLFAYYNSTELLSSDNLFMVNTECHKLIPDFISKTTFLCDFDDHMCY